VKGYKNSKPIRKMQHLQKNLVVKENTIIYFVQGITGLDTDKIK
jgi:hypothetical protein